MHRTLFWSLLASAAITCLPSALEAQGDHLHCYEINDALALRGVINLESSEFGLEEGCEIGRAALFCSPAKKSVVEAFNDETGEAIDRVILASPPAERNHLCYSVRCPGQGPSPMEVTDQFGTRTISSFSERLVCTPTVKGAPEHKVAFITSRRVAGNFGGLAAADALCADLAAEANLSGSFLAWISDSTGDPNRRFTRSLTPYVRTDGERIANDYSDLTDGTIAVPILADENGDVVTGGFLVWTGTSQNGSAASGGTFRTNCRNWRTTNEGGTKGEAGNTRGWTHSGGITNCTVEGRLYCFEQ